MPLGTVPVSRGAAAGALAALAVVGLLTLAWLREGGGRLAGDEPTYQAMTESLARDGDLRFDERDEARLRDSEEVLILQRTAPGVSYSKPALYPLLAAPLSRWLGDASFRVVNVAALALALGAGWLFLRRLGERGEAALTLVTFAGTGVLLGYVGWRMSDALQAALALAGLVLALAAERGPAEGRGRSWSDRFLESWPAWAAGGLALGLLASLRYPNALLAAAAAAALALRGRLRRAALVLAFAGLGFAASGLLNQTLGGAFNPYKTVRASFNVETGFPVQVGAGAWAQFDEQRKTYRMGVRPELEPALSAYSALYCLAGRHTGLLVYFPAALVLAAAGVRRADRLSLALVAGAAALAVFYLIWLPRNYFGGASFLGNRYFLAAYPALLVALRRPLGGRGVACVWVVALAVLGSAVVSTARTRGLEVSSQSHAYAGLFRWLPFESTAQALDGPRDRYWSDEFLRFADPWAEVETWGFRLAAGRPAAEVMMAAPRRYGVLRFIVQADVPEATLVYRDWGQRRSFALAPAPGEGIARGVVEVEPSPSWRRHPFPWKRHLSWSAWVFRLSLHTPDGAPGGAELRYLGPYRLVPKFFSREVLAFEPPRRATAGARDRLPLTVRNTGRRPWASQEAVPVHLRYRLEPAAGGAPIVGRVTRLPRAVGPGEALEGAVEVRWPRRAGRYRLSVDLVLAGTVWLGELAGAAPAGGEVEVVEGG